MHTHTTVLYMLFYAYRLTMLQSMMVWASLNGKNRLVTILHQVASLTPITGSLLISYMSLKDLCTPGSCHFPDQWSCWTFKMLFFNLFTGMYCMGLLRSLVSLVLNFVTWHNFWIDTSYYWDNKERTTKYRLQSTSLLCEESVDHGAY